MQNLPLATPGPTLATALFPAASQPPQSPASMNFAGQLALAQLGVVASMEVESRLASDEAAPAMALPAPSPSISAPRGMPGAMSQAATWFDPGSGPASMLAAPTPPVSMSGSSLSRDSAPVSIAEPFAVGAAGVSATEPPRVGSVIASSAPTRAPITATVDPGSATGVSAVPSAAPKPPQLPGGQLPGGRLPGEQIPGEQSPGGQSSGEPSPDMPSVVRRAIVPDGFSQSASEPNMALPPSLPDDPSRANGKDLVADDNGRDNPLTDATLPVLQRGSENLDWPSAIPANPTLTTPLSDVPTAPAPVRRSSGRLGMGDPDRDAAPSPVADPSVVPVHAPAMIQTFVPPVPSLPAQDGGGRHAEPPLANLSLVGTGPGGAEFGGTEPQAPAAMINAPRAGPLDVSAETRRRVDMDLAAQSDLPTSAVEAIAPSHAEPQSQALSPQGSSHRLDAPVPLSPDPRAQASVTDQIAPVMISLGQAPDGAHRMTLRLNPGELGLVEIRIDRPADAPPRVQIMVERPETLILLLRDQAQLERALDQAGLPPDGRGLSIQVSPIPLAPPVDPSAQMGQTASGQAGVGADLADGSAGSQGGAARQDRSGAGSPMADAARTESGTIPARARWLAAGLDITA